MNLQTLSAYIQFFGELEHEANWDAHSNGSEPDICDQDLLKDEDDCSYLSGSTSKLQFRSKFEFISLIHRFIDLRSVCKMFVWDSLWTMTGKFFQKDVGLESWIWQRCLRGRVKLGLQLELLGMESFIVQWMRLCMWDFHDLSQFIIAFVLLFYPAQLSLFLKSGVEIVPSFA